MWEKQEGTRVVAEPSVEPTSPASQPNLKKVLLLQLRLQQAPGMRLSAPRLSAYLFLAWQTLQSPWEPVYAVSADREARRGSPAVTPHTQGTLGC